MSNHSNKLVNGAAMYGLKTITFNKGSTLIGNLYV